MNNEIKIKDFCNFADFIDEVTQKLVSLSDCGSVSIIADEPVIKKVLKYIISNKIRTKDGSYTEFDLGIISFDPIDYDKEHILTLSYDHTVWCEPMWRNNENGAGYIGIESESVYIHKSCNYRINERIDSEDISFFGIEN